MKKAMVYLLILAMLLGLTQVVTGTEVQAAKKMKLSKSKASIQVGKTLKLKVKNKKKNAKVTWKSGNKKIATVSQKGVVKGKKKGTATIKATVKYNKKKTVLKCKITVKKKTSSKKDTVSTNKPTTETVAQPTATPIPVTSMPATATPAPTVNSVSDSTASTDQTGKKMDISDAVLWNESDGSFDIDAITFEDSALTYQYMDKKVYVNSDSETDIKNIVPNVEKCTFTVKAGNQTYKDVTVANVEYSEEPWYSNTSITGYYTFRLYIEKDGKVFYQQFNMVYNYFGYLSLTRKMQVTGIKYDGKEIQVETDADSNSHLLVDIGNEEDVQSIIPDLKKAEFKAVVDGQELKNVKVSSVSWSDSGYYKAEKKGTGYYSFRLSGECGNEVLEKWMSLSDYDDNIYADAVVGTDSAIADTHLSRKKSSRILAPIGKNENLKDKFKALAKNYTIQLRYRNQRISNVPIEDVVWHDESFYDDGSDEGYYTFKVNFEYQGQRISKTFFLLSTLKYEETEEEEQNQEKSYKVSGTVTDIDGKVMSEVSVQFSFAGGGYYRTYTDNMGAYEIYLPAREYSISVSSDKEITEENFVVGNADVTKNIQTKICHISGHVLNNGKSVGYGYYSVYTKDSSDGYQYYTTFYTSMDDGSYDVFLPKGTYYVSRDYGEEEYYELKVDSSAENQNINISYYLIGGTVYQYGDTIYESGRTIYFEKEDGTVRSTSAWYGTYSFATSGDSEYSVYTYVNGEKMDLGKVKVGKADITKDLTLNLYTLSGKVLSKNGIGISSTTVNLYDRENNNFLIGINTETKGRYSFEVTPGKYALTLSEESAQENVSVADSDVKQNISAAYAIYHLTGNISNQGTAFKGRRIWFKKSDYKQRVTTDDYGNYDIYLPEGDYTAYPAVCKKVNVQVKVTKDEEKNFSYTLYHLYGNIYKNALKGTLNNGAYFRIFLKNGKKLSSKKRFYGYRWYSKWFADQGDYVVKDDRGRQLNEFTINAISTRCDINYDAYTVSGRIMGLRGTDSREVEFKEENGGYCNTWLYNYDENAPYSIDLPNGTYQVMVDGINCGSVTVANKDVTQDIQCYEQIKLSGKVKMNGEACSNANINWYEKKKVDNEAYTASGSVWTDINGNYTVYLPKGTYYFKKYCELNNQYYPLQTSDIELTTDRVFDFDFMDHYVQVNGSVLYNGEADYNNKSLAFYAGADAEGISAVFNDNYSYYTAYLPKNTSFTAAVTLFGDHWWTYQTEYSTGAGETGSETFDINAVENE